MRANTTPRISTKDPSLVDELRSHAKIINALADGRLAGANNATTAAPTAGSYAPGDFVRNSAPAEAGGGGSMYVILGWLCLDDDPLTFVECRVLTGN